VPQAPEVADRLTTQDQHQGQVEEYLARVIRRVELRGRIAADSSAPQPGPLASSRSGERSGMPDQSVVIAGELEPIRPRRTCTQEVHPPQ
jgi:hypothetical protein